jgi:hypothetical protein
MLAALIPFAFLIEPTLVMSAGVSPNVSRVKFSPDSQSLFAVSANGGDAPLFVISKGKATELIKAPGRGRGAGFSFATKQLTTVHEEYRKSGNVMVVDTQVFGSGVEAKHFDASSGSVMVLPSGDHFAVSNKSGTTIYATANFTPLFNWSTSIHSLAIGPKEAVAHDGKNLLILGYPSGQVLRSFPFKAQGVGIAFLEREHRILISGDENLQLLDSQTGKVIWTNKELSPSSAFQISPNHRYAVVGNLHGGLLVIRLRDGKLLFHGGSGEMGSTYPTMAADWSPNGRLIAGGFYTGEVKVWDVMGITR